METARTRFDNAAAERIVDALRAATAGRIRRILLYGSRARGTAEPESDVDLLVVASDPVDKHEARKRLKEAAKAAGRTPDLWVMGEEEFEETKDVIGGLAYPAHKYGIVLYEDS